MSVESSFPNLWVLAAKSHACFFANIGYNWCDILYHTRSRLKCGITHLWSGTLIHTWKWLSIMSHEIYIMPHALYHPLPGVMSYITSHRK